jgi:hypothetical protein
MIQEKERLSRVTVLMQEPPRCPIKGIVLNQMHWAQQHISGGKNESCAVWRLFEEQRATACRMGVGVGDDCRGGGESGDGQ